MGRYVWVNQLHSEKTTKDWQGFGVRIVPHLTPWFAFELFSIRASQLSTGSQYCQGFETEQPIRVIFCYLTWWPWCLAPPLQFFDTQSSHARSQRRLLGGSENCILFWWPWCLAPPVAAWTEYRLHNVYGVSPRQYCFNLLEFFIFSQQLLAAWRCCAFYSVNIVCLWYFIDFAMRETERF